MQATLFPPGSRLDRLWQAAERRSAMIVEPILDTMLRRLNVLCARGWATEVFTKVT